MTQKSPPPLVQFDLGTKRITGALIEDNDATVRVLPLRPKGRPGETEETWNWDKKKGKTIKRHRDKHRVEYLMHEGRKRYLT